MSGQCRQKQARHFVWLAALVLVLVVSLIGPVPAQADPGLQKGGIISISYDEAIGDFINAMQQEVVFAFEGTAGDVVSITMQVADGDLDPYLVLYDTYPSQSPLANDDDSAGNLDAQIREYRLPYTGTFYIVATRYGRETGSTQGRFLLMLERGASRVSQPQQPSGLASFDCNGALVDTAARVTFDDVRPGFTYRVTVAGLDGFDPVIALFAEDGSSLCNDDEPAAVGSVIDVPGVGVVTADNLTSQILFTTSGSIGDIDMEIGGFGGTSGRFVAVFEGLAIAPSTEQDAATITTIPTGAGEELYVYMVSETTALDPYMTLPQMGLVCDDAGSGDCAGVPPFMGRGVSITNGRTYVTGQYDSGLGVIPSGAPLTFQFTSFGGGSSGNYAMIVIGHSASVGGAAGSQPTGIRPGLGQAAAGFISDSSWFTDYPYNGTAGETIDIIMNADIGSDLDSYLMLFDPSGSVLVEDDDGNGSLDSRIIYTLPYAGRYTIRATRYGQRTGATSGAYNLVISQGTGSTGALPNTTGSGLDYSQSPTYGSASLSAGFSPDPYNVSMASGGSVDAGMAVGGNCYGYVASAPDFRLNYTSGSYRLRIFFYAASGDTTLIINAPDGQWYCDDDGGGSWDPKIDFSSPLSGQYDIWVGTLGSTSSINGTLTITETDLMP